MTIKEFINGYNKINSNNTTLQTKYIKDNLKIKDYIPFETKFTIANKIVQISTFKKDIKNGEYTDKVIINSPIRYLFFCKAVIELYTNLTCEDDNWANEYDMLKSSGLLDLIMYGGSPFVSESEITEFKTILDMVYQDVISNNATLQARVSKQFERFSDVGKVLIDTFSTQILDKIGSISDDKISDFVNGLVNVIAKGETDNIGNADK